MFLTYTLLKPKEKRKIKQPMKTENTKEIKERREKNEETSVKIMENNETGK